MKEKQKQKLFHEKIEPEYKRVFYFIYSRVGQDRELAQDLMQSSMELAWYKLEELQNRDAARSWLMQIAANEVRRYIRAQKAKKRDGCQEELSEINENKWIGSIGTLEDQVFDEVVKKEDRQRIMVALSQLDEPYREILELRMIQDLKFAEIAQIVNLKDSTTRTYYARALRQLKKEYCLLRGEEI